MKICFLSLCLSIGLVISATVSAAPESNYITSKYDFIPGEKVVFYDDFTSEGIGDFPAQWLTNGSGEIVKSQRHPGRWFNMTKMGYYIPEVKEAFTDNYTIEFDFVPMNTINSENMFGLSFYLLTGSLSEPGGGGEPGDAGFQIALDYDNLGWKNWSMDSGQRLNGNVAFSFKSKEKYHIAIWVQKQRVRFYANETKVLDVPRAIPSGKKSNIFRFDSRDEAVPLISNFRIAVGLPDMRNRLLKEGKIVSYGIQFDVNSDKLRPESYSTLKELSDILKENPAIRIQVVGHTDSDGDDPSNLDLSKRRAVSVKNELVTKFTIEAARLETDGKGESQPLAENSSAVNKARNRRVELINLKGDTKPTINTKASAFPGTAGVPVVPADAKTYKSVLIGAQTWMAENLNVSRFKNGDPIPEAKTNEEWVKASPAWCFYNNDPKNEAKYGKLYNWYAMVDPRGLAPAGWHIPSEAEWNILNTTLGGIAASGAKMKSTSGWDNKGNGTNKSGFSGLPGGYRHNEGTFNNLGTMGFWISTTDTATGAISHTLNNANNYFGWGVGKAKDFYGFSVRCVKD